MNLLPGWHRPLLMIGVMIICHGAGQAAQAQNTKPAEPAINPITLLDNASKVLPGVFPADPKARPAEAAPADDAPPPQGNLSAAMSILVLLTVLTVAPAILILCTSFTRIIVVLSLLRQAIGTQNLPPSQVIVGLSMFMTFLVMGPTFERINKEAIQPLTNNEISQIEAWTRAKKPVREFMFAQIDYANNWDDIYMVLQYRGIDVSEPHKLTEDDVDMLTLVPAFILSELKVAFLMGFRLYLPFLVIDMVISSILISMGMLMLPPVLISLPFKLLLFVLVDGWRLVAGNLLNSFAQMPG